MDTLLCGESRQNLEQKKFASSAGWLPYLPAVLASFFCSSSCILLLQGRVSIQRSSRASSAPALFHPLSRMDLFHHRVRYLSSRACELLLLQLLSTRCPGWRHAVRAGPANKRKIFLKKSYLENHCKLGLENGKHWPWHNSVHTSPDILRI